MSGMTNVTMSSDSKRDFLARKLKLLRRFKDGLSGSPEWVSSLFLPVEIPVYVVLTRKLQEQHIEKFDMRDFSSLETLNGIEVYEATKDNLNQLANGGKSVVLLNHLYSVKYLVNPVDIPKKKKKNYMNDWVRRRTSYGYDALYRGAKNRNQGGSWVVWDPYVMFPVHRIEITDVNREAIVNALPEKTQLHEQYLKVLLKKPTEASTPVPSVISDEATDKLRTLISSASPLYEVLNVWYPWNGKTLYTGATQVTPPGIEKALASTLNFFPQLAGSTRSKSPFGGMKYLKRKGS
ncbi:hypothetical protein P3T76_003974 [Phytophthora citrophthora]|uniref:Uncharacterized protein n=1 Tax=Phytophthora citrophthora TaxID=4793 RepID=A0AAD9LQX9_9STRA|nr:hypothetical protein P3T76_003974 [Phytophthora citrophthora]